MRFIFILLFLFIAGRTFSQSLTEDKPIPADSAIVYYKKILQKDKQSTFANYGLASVYFEKREFKLAEFYARENIRKENEYRLQCWIIYAASLDRQTRIADAIIEFEKALKFYPTDYPLLYQYAFSCYKYREFEKALAATEKAIQAEPLSIYAHKLYACILFEKDNNGLCVHAILYSLMLDQDKQSALRSIQFINDFLAKKQVSINIPFFDDRLALENIDDVIRFYLSKRENVVNSKNQLSEDLAQNVSTFIKEAAYEETNYIGYFYLKLINEGLANAYSYYCLRFWNNEKVNLWLKDHSTELDMLASFLEKNMSESASNKTSTPTLKP